LLNCAPASNKQHELVTALNGYKDELGAEWGKWKKRIKRYSEDADRIRFYVSQKCYDDFSQLAKDVGYFTLVKYLESLPEQITLNGLNTNGVFYDLNELLTPFADAMVDDDAMTLDSADSEPGFSVLTILRKITDELKKNHIQDYKNLCSQLKQARKTDKYDNALGNQPDDKDQLITELKAEVATLNQEKAQTIKANADLRADNKRLQIELNTANKRYLKLKKAQPPTAKLTLRGRKRS
jgi:hypothetical protein